MESELRKHLNAHTDTKNYFLIATDSGYVDGADPHLIPLFRTAAHENEAAQMFQRKVLSVVRMCNESTTAQLKAKFQTLSERIDTQNWDLNLDKTDSVRDKKHETKVNANLAQSSRAASIPLPRHSSRSGGLAQIKLQMSSASQPGLMTRGVKRKSELEEAVAHQQPPLKRKTIARPPSKLPRRRKQ